MSFKDTQKAFTAHLRDPEHAPAPNAIEDRRMNIYRELLFNNVESFLAGQFPVLKSLSSDAFWTQLARGFFKTHKSQSPFFLDIAKEFLDYLQTEHAPLEDEPPFLYELAHYEWTELAAMSHMDEVHITGQPIDTQQSLTVNPTTQILVYTYPVHQIRADFQPSAPNEQPIFLLVCRNAEDEVIFIETTGLVARLLEIMQSTAQPLAASLQQLHIEAPNIAFETLEAGCLNALAECKAKHVIL